MRGLENAGILHGIGSCSAVGEGTRCSWDHGRPWQDRNALSPCLCPSQGHPPTPPLSLPAAKSSGCSAGALSIPQSGREEKGHRRGGERLPTMSLRPPWPSVAAQRPLPRLRAQELGKQLSQRPDAQECKRLLDFNTRLIRNKTTHTQHKKKDTLTAETKPPPPLWSLKPHILYSFAPFPRRANRGAEATPFPPLGVSARARGAVGGEFSCLETVPPRQAALFGAVVTQQTAAAPFPRGRGRRERVGKVGLPSSSVPVALLAGQRER